MHNAVALQYFSNSDHEKCIVSHERQLGLAVLRSRLCTPVLSLMFENLLVSVELR